MNTHSDNSSLQHETRTVEKGLNCNTGDTTHVSIETKVHENKYDSNQEYFSDQSESGEEYETAEDEEDTQTDSAQLYEIVEKLPEEDKLERQRSSKEFRDEGNQLFMDGSYKSAIIMYSRGLRSCPLKYKTDRAILYANRGACKVKLGQFEEAITDCSKAIDLNPVYTRALMRRAGLYKKTEKLDEALTDYRKVLELDPSHHQTRSACISQVVVNPNPTRVEVQFKALESTNTAFSSRLSTLEESVRTSEKLIQELFQQLRETKDENRSLRAAPHIPGPGFLSQSNWPIVSHYMQTQPGVCPAQSPLGAPSISTSSSQKGAKEIAVTRSTTSTQIMLPNVIVSSSVETHSKLIPGSADVPPTNPQTGPANQSVLSTLSLFSESTVDQMSKTRQSTKGLFGQSIFAGQTTPVSITTPTSSILGQTTSGSAASMHTQLSSKEQLPQNPFLENVSTSTPQKMVFKGFSSTSTPKITETKPSHIGKDGKPKLDANEDPKPLLGFSFTSAKTFAPATSASSPTKAAVSVGQATAQVTSTPQSQAGSGFLFGTITPTTSFGVQIVQGSAGYGIKENQKLTPQMIFQDRETKDEKQSLRTAPQLPGPGYFSKSNWPIVSPLLQTQPGVCPAQSQLGLEFNVARTSPAISPGVQGIALTSLTTTTMMPANAIISSSVKAKPKLIPISASKGAQSDGFSGSGLPVFGKSQSPRHRNPSHGSDDDVEEYESSVDFKPIVSLPALVDVKTGEEDEKKMFADRAKLFRFDVGTKQWKERGIGELKILKHRQTGQFRVLMRREQVLKLCANHAINTDMKLTPMMSSDKAWVWTAPDFSEEEMKYEKMAARFKNVDRASEFKSVFEKCREELKTVNDNRTEGNTADSVNASNNGVASKGQESLSEMFKPNAGAWTCDGCYIQRGPDVLVCPCCETKNPGATAEQLKAASDKEAPLAVQGGFTFSPAPSSQNTTGAFKFGASGIPTDSIGTSSSTKPVSGFYFGAKDQNSLAELFKPKAGSWTCNGCYRQRSPDMLKCLCCGTNKPGVTPGGIQAASSKSALSERAGGGFKFGSVSKPQTKSSQAFTFGTDKGFGSLKAAKPQSFRLVFGNPAEATSTGFNIKKEETTYPFAAASFTLKNTAEESAVSENSPLEKYLTCPENWTCYKCQRKLKGMTDVCPKCEITREESVGKEKVLSLKQSGFAFSSYGLFRFGESDQISNKGGSQTGFAFGKPKSISVSSLPKPSSEGFNFSFPPALDGPKAQPQAAVGSGFNFSLSITRTLTETTPTKSTAQASNLRSTKSPEITHDGYYVDKDGDDLHINFEPVVPLPEKVEIKLGEEDEEVVFTHRAKLYRFSAGEWKKGGLGDVKVLYHAEKNKARLVMRRAAILKICCNHYITPDINFKPMPHSNNCALVWFALDFTEDEPQTEQFSIKFKNADIVFKFESAIQEVMDRIAGKSGEAIGTPNKATAIETVGAKITITGQSETKSNPQSIEDPDCIFVREEKATDEQIQKARQFKLPDHFYLYDRLPDCAGCRGCYEDCTYENEIGQSGVETYQKTSSQCPH